MSQRTNASELNKIKHFKILYWIWNENVTAVFDRKIRKEVKNANITLRQVKLSSKYISRTIRQHLNKKAYIIKMIVKSYLIICLKTTHIQFAPYYKTWDAENGRVLYILMRISSTSMAFVDLSIIGRTNHMKLSLIRHSGDWSLMVWGALCLI